MTERWQRLRMWMDVEKPFIPRYQAEKELAGFPAYSSLGGLQVCRTKPNYYSFKYCVVTVDNIEAWRKKRDKMMQEADWEIIA